MLQCPHNWNYFDTFIDFLASHPNASIQNESVDIPAKKKHLRTQRKLKEQQVRIVLRECCHLVGPAAGLTSFDLLWRVMVWVGLAWFELVGLLVWFGVQLADPTDETVNILISWKNDLVEMIESMTSRFLQRRTPLELAATYRNTNIISIISCQFFVSSSGAGAWWELWQRSFRKGDGSVGFHEPGSMMAACSRPFRLGIRNAYGRPLYHWARTWTRTFAVEVGGIWT